MPKKKKIKARRIWKRNPITQIVPNKKHKKDKKLTTRDLMNSE